MITGLFANLLGGLGNDGAACGRLGNPYQSGSLAQYQGLAALSPDELRMAGRNRAALLAHYSRREPTPEELARQKAEAEYDGWLREWGMLDQATSAP